MSLGYSCFLCKIVINYLFYLKFLINLVETKFYAMKPTLAYMQRNSLFIAFFTLGVILLPGCTYYKYVSVPLDTGKVSELKSNGKYKPENNYYVLHFDGKMYSLKNIQLNIDEKSITGELTSLEELPLFYDELYRKRLKEKGININDTITGYPINEDPIVVRRKKGQVASRAVEQVHIFAGSVSFVNDINVKIMQSDIEQIGIYANAEALNAAIFLVDAAAIVGVSAVVVVLIACNCPHVYIYDGLQYNLVTSLYTGAKAPQLERDDYKQIPDFLPGSEKYEMKIMNEESESQYTDLVELLVVQHAANSKVYADQSGKIYTISDPIAPKQATNNDSIDVLLKVKNDDDKPYRFNAQSGTGLDELFLTFEKSIGITSGTLVLLAKNTKWVASVYDEFNSLFGKNFEEWVEMNKDKPLDERRKWMEEQGIPLLIEVNSESGWKTVEVIDLVGDIDFNSVAVRLEGLDPKNEKIEIRIRCGFLFWELDHVFIDYSSTLNLNVKRFTPSFVEGNDSSASIISLTYNDQKYMEQINTGDYANIRFENIPVKEELVRSIFLHSEGYYVIHKSYSGKTERKELSKYTHPGELSRLSKRMFNNAFHDVVIVDY